MIVEAEGLFRKSGLVLTIQTLKRDYDSGTNRRFRQRALHVESLDKLLYPLFGRSFVR